MKREKISFWVFLGKKKEILMKCHKVIRKVNEKLNFCCRFLKKVAVQEDFLGHSIIWIYT